MGRIPKRHARVAGLTLAVAAGAIAWFSFGVSRYYSSPTQARTNDSDSFADEFPIPVTKSTRPFEPPRQLPESHDHLLVFSAARQHDPIETTFGHGEVDAVGAIADLGNDQAVELVGVSVIWPKPGDPIDFEEGTAMEDLKFRHPATLEVIPDSKLDELGVPDSYRRQSRSGSNQVRLRLLFAGQNLPGFEPLNVGVYDGRTGFNLDRRREFQVENQGQIAKVDCKLRIWHDTSLRIGIDVRCGPLFVANAEHGGQQLQVAEDLEFAVGFTHPGVVRAVGNSPNRYVRDGFVPTLFRLEKAWMGTTSFGICSVPQVTKFGGIRESGNDRVVWFEEPQFESTGEEQGYNGYWSGFTAFLPISGGDKDLEFVFHPELKRMWFEVVGLPDMPNGRDLKDLFEVRIPRLVLPGLVVGKDDLNPRIDSRIADLTYHQYDENEYFTVEPLADSIAGIICAGTELHYSPDRVHADVSEFWEKREDQDWGPLLSETILTDISIRELTTRWRISLGENGRLYVDDSDVLEVEKRNRKGVFDRIRLWWESVNPWEEPESSIPEFSDPFGL